MCFLPPALLSMSSHLVARTSWTWLSEALEQKEGFCTRLSLNKLRLIRVHYVPVAALALLHLGVVPSA